MVEKSVSLFRKPQDLRDVREHDDQCQIQLRSCTCPSPMLASQEKRIAADPFHLFCSRIGLSRSRTCEVGHRSAFNRLLSQWRNRPWAAVRRADQGEQCLMTSESVRARIEGCGCEWMLVGIRGAFDPKSRRFVCLRLWPVHFVHKQSAARQHFYSCRRAA